MGVWRNGSASDFDCHSLSEGCSFEYCHAHPFCKSDSTVNEDVRTYVQLKCIRSRRLSLLESQSQANGMVG